MQFDLNIDQRESFGLDFAVVPDTQEHAGRQQDFGLSVVCRNRVVGIQERFPQHLAREALLVQESIAFEIIDPARPG